MVKEFISMNLNLNKCEIVVFSRSKKGGPDMRLMALFYQLEKQGNVLVGEGSSGNTCMLWRRTSRKHGDPSSITEVLFGFFLSRVIGF